MVALPARPCAVRCRAVHVARYRLSAAGATGLVAAVAIAVCLPNLLNGPGPIADDWVFLRNARFDGWLHAAGPRQSGRPGGALVYDLTFGLIGNHPLAVA